MACLDLMKNGDIFSLYFQNNTYLERKKITNQFFKVKISSAKNLKILCL